jgi:nitroimidazol reductase NimA-like FMN-containing flavoprotein (pyridoxamine 5'-phosphate oxidase superfamily)
MSMSRADAEAFLADVHVGVFAIDHPGHGPLALPIWYLFEDGEVVFFTDSATLKARLIQPGSRATLTAQNEAPPYKYVSVEGPVRVEPRTEQRPEMAIRYLGEQGGAAYSAAQPIGPTSIVVRIAPERWRTADYS